MLHDECITTEHLNDFKYSAEQFKAMCLTKLVEQSLVAIAFTQILVNIDPKRQGVLEEDVLRKELVKLNDDMEVMILLDPTKLASEQKCQTLMTVNLIKEK